MSEKEKKYHHASHSKYLLLAHLVFAVSVDDFTKLIEGFATVLKNFDEARELMETSEIGTVLVHIGTFATMLKRFEIASDRIVAEVEGQIEDFKIGAESRHAMAKDIYQRYYKGKRRPKKG